MSEKETPVGRVIGIIGLWIILGLGMWMAILLRHIRLELFMGGSAAWILGRSLIKLWRQRRKDTE